MDDLDALIAERTTRNPRFPQMMEAARETRRLVRELAAERERQGLSQEAVAVALGTKQPNIARLERGGVEPRGVTLVSYAALLGKRVILTPAGPGAAAPQPNAPGRRRASVRRLGDPGR